MGLALYVHIYRANQLVDQHQFDGDQVRTIKMGRLNSAQIKLDDPAASRIHAVIEIAPTGVSLIDMGSAAGTLVNDAKVHKTKLNHGDRVTIGETTLLVGLGQPAGQPAMAPGMVPGGMPMAPGYPPMAGGSPGGLPAGAPQAMPGSMAGAMPGAVTGVFPAAPAMAPGMMTGAPSPMPGLAPGMMPAGAPGGGFVAGMPGAPGGVVPMGAGMPGIAQGGAAVAVDPTFASPPGAATGVATGVQPQFDGGVAVGGRPERRATRERVFSAAVESRPHPSLPPEPALAVENRVLEMRAYWGEVLLGVYHYKSPKKITLGETKGTDFFISSEGLPTEIFPFVRTIDDEYVLTFTKQMDGEIEIDGELHPLEHLRGSSLARKDPDLEESYQINLGLQTRALVHWGGATFALRFVPPAKPPARALFQGMDLQYVNTLVLSFFFHVATVATMMWYPYDTAALRVDLFDEDAGRFANIVLEGPTQNKSTEDLLERLKKQVEEKKEKLTPPKELKQPDPEVVAKNRPQQQQRVKTKQERQAEVKQRFSKLFSSGSGQGGGSLLGGGGGGTLSGTLSNVIGTAGTGSSTAGLQGLGIRGTGPMTGGGIGTSRGIAGIGTSGRAGGQGLAYGSGIGIGKKENRGMISLSTPVVMGALPKEAIQKVIDQNKAQIRYCYELQLQRDQNLEGRVMMTWIIAATGAVAQVKVRESTMKNPAVERCIASKIKTWMFPAPSGGGIVEVNYPFVLRAG